MREWSERAEVSILAHFPLFTFLFTFFPMRSLTSLPSYSRLFTALLCTPSVNAAIYNHKFLSYITNVTSAGFLLEFYLFSSLFSPLPIRDSPMLTQVCPLLAGIEVCPLLAGIEVCPLRARIEVCLLLAGIEVCPLLAKIEVCLLLAGIEVCPLPARIEVCLPLAGIEVCPLLARIEVCLSWPGWRCVLS